MKKTEKRQRQLYQVTDLDDNEYFEWEVNSLTLFAKKLLRKYLEDRGYKYSRADRREFVDAALLGGEVTKELLLELGEAVLSVHQVTKKINRIPLSTRDKKQIYYIIYKTFEEAFKDD